MSVKDSRGHDVNQSINGSGHQIAGGCIHNHTHFKEYQPLGQGQYIFACKACGWNGVAVTADECKKCGYNYALERAIAAKRERKAYERLVLGVIYGAGGVIITSAWLGNNSSLGFFNALAVCSFTAVIAWGAFSWLRAWCSVKWKGLKRR